MPFENLWNVWEAGGRLYARCEKPRREGLKSVRPCSNQYELDVARSIVSVISDVYCPLLQYASQAKKPISASRKITTNRI
jgi:hypothetical protein